MTRQFINTVVIAVMWGAFVAIVNAPLGLAMAGSIVIGVCVGIYCVTRGE